MDHISADLPLNYHHVAPSYLPRAPNLLINHLNACIFNGTPESEKSPVAEGDLFPLRINVVADSNKIHREIGLVLQAVEITDVPDAVELRCASRTSADSVVTQLIQNDYRFTLDYSEFILHPGNLFVKNLNASLVDDDSLFDFFQNRSRFHTLIDVSIFKTVEDNCFAILKFDNYLDVEHVIDKLDTSHNPFHASSMPLYVNKYISKRERKLKADDFTPASAPGEPINLYNTIVVENVAEFFDYNPTFESLGKFLAKFELFHKIDSVYFPITKVADDDVHIANFGFISFEIDEHLNEDVLKCLYFLNNLLFEEFMAFELKDIVSITREEEYDDKPPTARGVVKISVGQHKHNHYLYQITKNRMALSWESGSVPTFTYIDINLHNTAISKFSKYLNYQETNIYVNNFPVVFDNDDELWEKFWKQFGQIKSAKIIKPQFYSKKSTESTGKIGFVFFEAFRLCVRAILLTNDKTISTSVSGINHLVHVQSSFAIQKNNNSPSLPPQAQRASLPTNYYDPSTPNYAKRFSWPSENYYYSAPPIVSPPLGDYGSMYNPYVYYNYPYMMRELSPPDTSRENNNSPSDFSNYYISPQPANFNYFVPYEYGSQQPYSPQTPPVSTQTKHSKKANQKKKS